MKTNRKVTRGGRREGAGRKTAGTVHMVIRPLAETAERLRAMAEAKGKTPGQIIDDLV